MSDPRAADRYVVGIEPGRTPLGGGAHRALGTSDSVLPELADAPARQRRWWLHPAFLVSMILTVLALVGAGVWVVLSALNDDSVKVSSLSLEIGGGNAHLSWTGPDAAYALYSVGADGTVVDLTQSVVGTDAWIGTAMGLFDEQTCFVVRPANVTDTVSLEAATLQAQRGAGVCVADAAAG